MRKVKSTNSSAELTLRRALHQRGLRYRLHVRGLPGKPDIVFPSHRVAVFVDGDFWHGRQWRARGLPNLEAQFRSNREYWVRKIEGTVARDQRVTAELEQLGWIVVRLWETDILRDTASCVNEVVDALSSHQVRGQDCWASVP